MPVKVKRTHRSSIEVPPEMTWKELRQHLKARLGIILLFAGFVWSVILLAIMMVALTRS